MNQLILLDRFILVSNLTQQDLHLFLFYIIIAHRKIGSPLLETTPMIFKQIGELEFLHDTTFVLACTTCIIGLFRM